jgi:hypothetical protein
MEDSPVSDPTAQDDGASNVKNICENEITSARRITQKYRMSFVIAVVQARLVSEHKNA